MRQLKQLLKDNSILIGIIALAIILRILYLGHVEFDEINYITGAKHILAGIFEPITAFPTSHLRYVLMLFLAGYIKMFGYQYPTMVPITLISSLGSIVVVYFLGMKLWNKRVAIIAAFLLAIFPLNVKYSSFLEADIIISFLMGLCALFYFYEQSKRSFFVIGALIGLSFYVKFFNMLILLVIVFHSIIEKRFKLLFTLFLGFFIAISPFIIYEVVKTGNPLHHVNFIQTEVLQYNEVHENDDPFVPYLFNPFLKQPEPALFSIFPLLLIIFCLKYRSKRTKEEIFFWLWLILGYLILELHPVIPAIQRYMLIVEIPLILLTAQLVNKITSNSKIIFCFLLLFSFSIYQLGEPTFNDSHLT